MKKLLVLLAVPALLTGCASTVDNGPNYEPKANFSDFKDITWLPETSVRAPYNARELTVNVLDALRKPKTKAPFPGVPVPIRFTATALPSKTRAAQRPKSWKTVASSFVPQATRTCSSPSR